MGCPGSEVQKSQCSATNTQYTLQILQNINSLSPHHRPLRCFHLIDGETATWEVKELLQDFIASQFWSWESQP